MYSYEILSRDALTRKMCGLLGPRLCQDILGKAIKKGGEERIIEDISQRKQFKIPMKYISSLKIYLEENIFGNEEIDFREVEEGDKRCSN